MAPPPLSSERFEVTALSEEDAAALWEALAAPNCAIRTLSLCGVGLAPFELEQLFAALRGNTSVLELDLSRNAVSGSSAVQLAEMLASKTDLTSLRLRGCALSSAGASRIVDELVDYVGLMLLDLASNELTEGSVPSLRRLLQRNASLAELNLSHNRIESGLSLLGSALERNSALSQLHLAGNDMLRHDVSEFAGALRLNTTLHRLVINPADREAQPGNWSIVARYLSARGGTVAAELEPPCTPVQLDRRRVVAGGHRRRSGNDDDDDGDVRDDDDDNYRDKGPREGERVAPPLFARRSLGGGSSGDALRLSVARRRSDEAGYPPPFADESPKLSRGSVPALPLHQLAPSSGHGGGGGSSSNSVHFERHRVSARRDDVGDVDEDGGGDGVGRAYASGGGDSFDGLGDDDRYGSAALSGDHRRPSGGSGDGFAQQYRRMTSEALNNSRRLVGASSRSTGARTWAPSDFQEARRQQQQSDALRGASSARRASEAPVTSAPSAHAAAAAAAAGSRTSLRLTASASRERPIAVQVPLAGDASPRRGSRARPKSVSPGPSSQRRAAESLASANGGELPSIAEVLRSHKASLKVGSGAPASSAFARAGSSGRSAASPPPLQAAPAVAAAAGSSSAAPGRQPSSANARSLGSELAPGAWEGGDRDRGWVASDLGLVGRGDTSLSNADLSMIKPLSEAPQAAQPPPRPVDASLAPPVTRAELIELREQARDAALLRDEVTQLRDLVSECNGTVTSLLSKNHDMELLVSEQRMVVEQQRLDLEVMQARLSQHERQAHHQQNALLALLDEVGRLRTHAGLGAPTGVAAAAAAASAAAAHASASKAAPHGSSSTAGTGAGGARRVVARRQGDAPKSAR